MPRPMSHPLTPSPFTSGTCIYIYIRPISSSSLPPPPNPPPPGSSPMTGPHLASWFRTPTLLGSSPSPGLSATRWVSWAPGRRLTPGHRGRQAAALDSWAGSSGTGPPPLAPRSSGRRPRAVGLQRSGASGLAKVKGNEWEGQTGHRGRLMRGNKTQASEFGLHSRY